VKRLLVVVVIMLVPLVACSGPWKSYPGTVNYSNGKKINIRFFVTQTRDKGKLSIVFRQRDLEFQIYAPKPIKDYSGFVYVKYRFDDGPWVKSDDWVLFHRASPYIMPQAGTELPLIQEMLDAQKLYFEYEPKYDPPETLEFDVQGLKNAEDFSNQYTLRAKREESFDKCYNKGTTPADNEARWNFCDSLPDQR
jgi:hypothetical protein